MITFICISITINILTLLLYCIIVETKGGDLMETIAEMVVNNGTAIAVMIYFIYKDNKWTETLYSTLGAIKTTMKTIENHFIEKEKREE